MLTLGEIVMPCRRCNVAPGEACINVHGQPWRHPHGTGDLRFHTMRINDAAKASELLADTVAGATVR